MNVLRISKPQEWRKFKKNDPQTKFTEAYKKFVFLLLTINSKFTMDNCTQNFKNTLSSPSHANFRLDFRFRYLSL